MSELRFKIGDRVRIQNSGHPWDGHSGVIAAPFRPVTQRVTALQWLVQLDDYPSRSACAESDLQPEQP